MGNSAVYRIHTGDDLEQAYAMARRLLALAYTDCCPADVSVCVETGTHQALDRFLSIEWAMLALPIPAELTAVTIPALRPHLPPDRTPTLRRDGSAYEHLHLTPALVDDLLRLPPMPAGIDVSEIPLPSDLPGTILGLVGAQPATISWDVCWPGTHNESGFELALNGAEMWNPQPPAGHSLYVHVHPAEPEQAGELALAVGGRILSGPDSGW